MKNGFLAVLLLLLLNSCVVDDFWTEDHYLPYAPVDITINLNDPRYSALKRYETAIFIDDGYSGVLGVILFNSGAGYKAYEAACPSHPVRDCSLLQFDGTLLYCLCDDEDFSMHNGRSRYGGRRLKEYPVQTYRNTLSIQN